MQANGGLGGFGVAALDGLRDQAMVVHGAPGLLDAKSPQASRAREQFTIFTHQPLQARGVTCRRDGQVKLFV